ncbi:Exo-alpha-sialidase OS=Streptomyces tendae OX=1932 GN=F3L20_12280 PE=4 SV=1 [Streptomyces tendae]
MLAVCGTGAESGGLWWTEHRAGLCRHPALALDGRGRIVMAMVAADGAVLVNRQRPEPGLTLSDWVRLPGS